MPGPLLPENLLLIDDDELSRAVLDLHLVEAGFTVHQADGAEAALSFLRHTSAPVDLVLSDLQMPGLCGPALARALRPLLEPGTPLLAMSANQPSAEGLVGYDAFLLKPFAPADLFARLDELQRPEHAAEAAPPPAPGPAAASPLEAHHAPIILDDTTFDQLSAMLRPGQLAELFALSFSELDRHLALLERAFAEGDREGFRHSAHTIKGAAAIVGAHELQSLGAALETGGGSPADQAATLREIPLAAQRLRGMLSSRGVPLDPGPLPGSEPPQETS